MTEITWLTTIADPIRLRILHALVESAEASAAELAAHSHSSGQTVRRHLAALVAAGVLIEHPGTSDGETSGRPAARFSLAPAIRASVAAALAAAAYDAQLQ